MVHPRGGPQDARSLKIAYTEGAFRELAHLPKHVVARIFDKMKWYAAQRDPFHFAEPLRGRPTGASHRFRIGDYRVLVDREIGKLSVLVVLAVRHRREAYRL